MQWRAANMKDNCVTWYVLINTRGIDALNCSQPEPITDYTNTGSKYTDHKWQKLPKNSPKYPKMEQHG